MPPRAKSTWSAAAKYIPVFVSPVYVNVGALALPAAKTWAPVKSPSLTAGSVIVTDDKVLFVIAMVLVVVATTADTAIVKASEPSLETVALIPVPPITFNVAPAPIVSTVEVESEIFHAPPETYTSFIAATILVLSVVPNEPKLPTSVPKLLKVVLNVSRVSVVAVDLTAIVQISL